MSLDSNGDALVSTSNARPHPFDDIAEDMSPTGTRDRETLISQSPKMSQRELGYGNESTATLIGEEDNNSKSHDSWNGTRLTHSASASPRLPQDTSPLPTPSLIQRSWTEELAATKSKRDRPFFKMFQSESKIMARDEAHQLKILGFVSEAASKGYLADVEALIEKGANLKFPTTMKGSKVPKPLLNAIRANSVPIVELLLQQGANPNEYDEETQLPCLALAWTLHQENVAMLDTLLRFQADPNATFASSMLPNSAWTMLHELVFAAGADSLDMMERLLNNGANVNYSKDGVMTPLQAACSGPRTFDASMISVRIAKRLIECGADVKAPFREYTEILPAVCEKGDAELAQVLLECGANPNSSRAKVGNRPACSAFHLACQTRNERLVKLLLDNGADLERTDGDGKTPLLWAIACGDLAMVKLLTSDSYNAKLNVHTFAGDTPLHIACALPQCPFDLVKYLLLADGCKYDEQNVNKELPIHFAAGAGNCRAVSCLLRHDVEMIDALDESGKAPLHFAVLNGHKDVVELLIQEAAMFGYTSNTRDNALHYAAGRGDVDIVQFLKKKGLSSNKKNVDGNTPVILAAHWWTDESQIVSEPHERERRYRTAETLFKWLIDDDTDLSVKNKEKKKASTVMREFKGRLEKANEEEPDGLPVDMENWDQCRNELLEHCIGLETILSVKSSNLAERVWKVIVEQ